MSDPISSDVFKFVAVRPPQKALRPDTQRGVIRDARAADDEGQRGLAALGRSLAADETARARWRERAPGEWEAWIEGHRALLRAYEPADSDGEVPDAGELLGAVDLGPQWQERKPLDQVWDALYLADSTGADAGPRLEGPIAALRLMHFAARVKDNAHPSRVDALAALRATPVLPPAFYAARAAARELAPPNPRGGAHAAPVERRNAALARELATTERLIRLVEASPPHDEVSIEEASLADDGKGWRRSEFRLQSRSTIGARFTGRLRNDDAAVLGHLQLHESASPHAAAQALQGHWAALAAEAMALGDDAGFQRQLRHALRLNKTSPFGDVGDLVDVDLQALPPDPNAEFAVDVNVAGRIRPLGIGDLKVVKQKLLAYVAGEVAHIENVMSTESKERKHRMLDRTETTLFSSEEETRDTERDTQTTDRFELKREAELIIKEDMSLRAGLTVTASYGPVVATATGDFAYSTSRHDSQKSSSNFAREIVDRSVTKVQKKTKTERTTKTINEVEEINTHGFDNTGGLLHITGIYRWVDKRYRAQVYNYGARLLVEFIVPEPAEFFRHAHLNRKPTVDATPPPPLLNVWGAPLTVADINETSYLTYSARYHTSGLTPPPPALVALGASLVKEGLDEGKTIGMSSKDLVVPEGYTMGAHSATVSIVWRNNPKFALQVGKVSYPLLDSHPGASGSSEITNATPGESPSVTALGGPVPISLAAYDVRAFAVNVQAVCHRTPEALAKWRLQTYDKIAAAWQALQTAYDQKVAQARAAAGVSIEGRNPGQNRAIERAELKKLCVTTMTGEHFTRYDAMTEPPPGSTRPAEVDVLAALEQGRIVQFFEQSFEWEQMTWLYYPYIWGRKKHWVEVSGLKDPDPMFMQFLTAGSARVVVPVPLAYRTSVEFLLQSPNPDLRARVWRGGERPTLDDPAGLYVSIDEELRNQTDDLAGAVPEGTPWEFTLPTTLVWLQPDATLPSFT